MGASADDFGIAMAFAGRSRGIEFELFGPVDSDPAKVEYLRHSGTIVRLDGESSDEARAEARRYSSLVDGRFVDDGDHIELSEGAATMAAELEHIPGEIDAIYVPIGRGSLAHGAGEWCHERMPLTRGVGVGAERGPGTVRSVLQGRLVRAAVAPGTAPELSVSSLEEVIVGPLSESLDDAVL
ncbi:MAG: threonine dehydratase [Candidatus Aldehydirespiratoraceae bacterium]